MNTNFSQVFHINCITDNLVTQNDTETSNKIRLTDKLHRGANDDQDELNNVTEI